MTAIDEIRTAAATIRKLADDATPGPWLRPLNTRYKATVTGPLPEGERGTWPDGIDPTTGQREQCTVAMVPTWSNGRHSRHRGGRDLEYIAAMHPSVGIALALLLEGVASSAVEDAHEECAPYCSPETCDVSAALAVAHALNGSQP